MKEEQGLVEKAQIYPSTKRTVPVDKIAKLLFNLTPEAYGELLEGSVGTVSEKVIKRTGDEIISTIKLKSLNEAAQSSCLNQFDYAVLSVCISEWLYGNEITTPSVIYRGLIGKTGYQHVNVTPAQKAEVLKSVEKLVGLIADIKLGNPEKTRLKASLLPCQILEAKANGQMTTIIHFLAESPLLTCARLKNNQLISYDTRLLNVPRQRNTVKVIAIKNYVLIRVLEIKQHNMTPTITLNDVFEKCQLEVTNPKIASDAREVIKQLLQNLVDCKIISGFEIVKKRTSIWGFRICL